MRTLAFPTNRLRRRDLWRLCVVVALPVLLAIWVERTYGWHSVLTPWQRIDAYLIPLVALAILASHGLRGYRVYRAFRPATRENFARVLGVSLIHNCATFLLPMRLGEWVLPALSRRQLAVNATYSTGCLILLRAFDAHVLLTLVVAIAGGQWISGVGWLACIAVLLGLPVGLIVSARLLLRLQRLAWLAPLLADRRLWLHLYALTLLIWLVKTAALATLALALADITFAHAWLGVLIADASALSPITGLANSGTYQAAFALPLLPLDYDGQRLLVLAINLHLVLIANNLIAGGVGWALLGRRQSTVEQRVHTDPGG